MATAVAAEVRSVLDAFKRHIATIEANTSNPKILDATYEMETIVAALWPEENAVGSFSERWRQYGLRPTGARIVDMLFRRLGKTVTYDALLTCWSAVGKDIAFAENIKVQICLARKKLKTSPYVIKTEHGIGFRMELRPTETQAGPAQVSATAKGRKRFRGVMNAIHYRTA